MKKILLFLIVISFSCKNEKSNDFIIEDEFADFVSPYEEKPDCDSEAESKLYELPCKARRRAVGSIGYLDIL